MQTASLENCKRLYELSGWDDEGLPWWRNDGQLGHRCPYEVSGYNPKLRDYPAYDAGYLLRKLQPIALDRGRLFLTTSKGNASWKCGFSATYDKYHDDKGEADTPDDALALLAIQLFESGILTKEGA